MAVSIVTFAVAAGFLVTSVVATPESALISKKRSLLYSSCRVESEEVRPDGRPPLFLEALRKRLRVL